ncbi:MAG: hypothetical protein CW691_08955 [Candidatus Bathyarchaeum sp.]|nr:MAG: hypothetical protein CW691_08955 [Candidatus Bathyarchaeum sp.]
MILYRIFYRVFVLLKGKKKSSCFSSRVDSEWIEILREEANRQGLSVNALHNKILKDYCEHGRWSKRLSVVTMSPQTFSGIIGGCSKETIEKIAKKSGSTGTKNFLRTMGVSPTYQNLISFIKKNLGESANWFDFTHHSDGKKEIIHLRHELGKNWSIFIATQVTTMFKAILDKSPTVEILENYVTLEITF